MPAAIAFADDDVGWIGTFNSDRFLRLRYDGKVCGELAMEFLHDGLPRVARQAAWQPPEPFDAVFSNAALQWMGDQNALLARMLSWLAPGGSLAVQVPGKVVTTVRVAAALVRLAPVASFTVTVNVAPVSVKTVTGVV